MRFIGLSVGFYVVLWSLFDCTNMTDATAAVRAQGRFNAQSRSAAGSLSNRETVARMGLISMDRSNGNSPRSTSSSSSTLSTSRRKPPQRKSPRVSSVDLEDAEPYDPEYAYFEDGTPYYASEYGEPFSEIAKYSNCYYNTPSNQRYDLTWCYGHQARHLPPPCITEDDVVYNSDSGAYSADQTLYKCMANIDDLRSAPTFYNGFYHGCLMIESEITLLNLVSVDEINGVAELQVIIDYSWIDSRYNMAPFWQRMRPDSISFDMTTILQSENIWMPEVVFPDAQSIDVMSTTLTLTPAKENFTTGAYDATFFIYEVTYNLQLVQPGFNFKNYPHDEQDIILRYTVLNYDSSQIQIFPYGVFCSYLPDGECSFSKNPIWKWSNEVTEFSCTAYSDPKKSGAYIEPSYAYYSIHIARQGMGIVVRLVLPLTLLLMISALTFWVSYENRVDTTITLLLSVSALYIVILQNIPMVGYLTAIDEFVFWMFFLLCLVVALHQAYATMFEKLDIWPLRAVYLRLVELVGRTFLLPTILSYFIQTMDLADKSLAIFLFVVVSLLAVAIFVRECYGVKATYYAAIERLVEKVRRPGVRLQEISQVEALVLNRHLFGVWSRCLLRLSEAVATNQELQHEPQTSVELRHHYLVADLLQANTAVDMRKTRQTSNHDVELTAMDGLRNRFSSSSTAPMASASLTPSVPANTVDEARSPERNNRGEDGSVVNPLAPLSIRESLSRGVRMSAAAEIDSDDEE